MGSTATASTSFRAAPSHTSSIPIKPAAAIHLTPHTQADRWQLYSNLFFKAIDWHGNHEFKVGVDFGPPPLRLQFRRQPISYLPTVESLPAGGRQAIPSPCSRYSQFSGPSFGEHYNVELSGYAQDRWLVTNRFLVEGGLRFDWDEVVRSELFSPRLAATYVLSQAANTKFSAGIGLFYDATPIFLIVRPQGGMRVDDFYDSSGALLSGPVTSVFSLPPYALEAPRYLNWSLGVEQKLPSRVYLKAEFIEKRSNNGFDYNWLNPVNLEPDRSAPHKPRAPRNSSSRMAATIVSIPSKSICAAFSKRGT